MRFYASIMVMWKRAKSLLDRLRRNTNPTPLESLTVRLLSEVEPYWSTEFVANNCNSVEAVLEQDEPDDIHHLGERDENYYVGTPDATVMDLCVAMSFVQDLEVAVNRYYYVGRGSWQLDPIFGDLSDLFATTTTDSSMVYPKSDTGKVFHKLRQICQRYARQYEYCSLEVLH